LRIRHLLLIVAAWPLATARAVEPAKAPEGTFLVRPYLQIGYRPSPTSLALLWHAADVDADWSVEYRTASDRPWRQAGAPTSRRVAVATVEPQRIYQAALTGLEPGGTFEYRVNKSGQPVFSSEGRAIKGADQPYRYAVFGDCGAGTAEQKPMALRAFQARPDFVVITGDIVYDRGRVSEYRDRFWPVYNGDEPSPGSGVPMMRSTPFVAAPGNHDTATRDLQRYPDGLAYFYNWAQPLNGPAIEEGGPAVPKLVATEAGRKAFVEGAGEAYPRMANFSFDYGNAHWTVLDANPYVDWTNNDLRRWVEADLAAARGATWRFVAFHHPGFNSAREHFEQQQMRALAPTFEAGEVDLVYNGHVHNYQRSFPLRFAPDNDGATPVAKDARPSRGRLVGGRWTLDKSFDGKTDTTPEGVIYLVTGAGGQHLYNPEQQDDPASWQGFTDKFISKIHTLTAVDVSGRSLTVRQVTAEGVEVDRFTVTK